MHLSRKAPFDCKTYYNELNHPSLITCRFDEEPTLPLETVQSDFFDIDFDTEGESFVLKIRPKHEAAIYPLPPPAYAEPVMDAHLPSRSDHWIVIGYSGRIPPYFRKHEERRDKLSFPIDFSRYAYPALGPVDLDGEPVFIGQNRDVEKFIAVKEAFAKGRYKRAGDLAEDALESYPDSIFASDFERYRIKALFALGIKENADQIIKLGKVFIKKHASDENLPEVLLMLARVYSATGFTSDANYFFDRLIQEHSDTKYGTLALIYLGDQLYVNGDLKKAMASYKQALYRAKDLDVASLAAYKLAVRNLEKKNVDRAEKYLWKIWKKNPDFLLKDPGDAYRLAEQLANAGRYDLPIAIVTALLKRLNKLDDLYEKSVYALGRWYDKKGKIKEAIRWYERYLKEFGYGEYSDEAKEKLDALFVVDRDENATRAMQKYEALIEKYGDEEIGEKALVAKLKVLLSSGRYEEVLAAGPTVERLKNEQIREEGGKIVHEAASAIFKRAAKAKACDRVVMLADDYNLTIPDRYDDLFYHCYVEFGRYDKAMSLVEKHVVEKDRDVRARWLCRAIDLHMRKGDPYRAKEAADELEILVDRPEKVCPKYQWKKVRIYHATDDYGKEMALIATLSRRHPDDVKMLELYKLGIEDARKHHDAAQQTVLLQKLLTLQKKKRIHPYSPWAEFQLIKLYKSMKEYDKALKIAESMENLPLKGEKEARRHYELGQLYLLNGRRKEAHKAFNACISVKNGGLWKGLCEQALTIE